MVIRPLDHEHELAQAAELIRRAFAPVAERFGLTPENAATHPAFQTAEALAEMTAQGLTLYGLFDDGVLVGVVGVKLLEGGRCSLEKLAVAPECQRRGYGERLVAYVCDITRQAGVETLRLAIIADHTELRDWYRKLGFIDGDLRQFRGLPFTVLFMSRSLPCP